MKKAFLLVSAVPLMLAACSSHEKPPFICPQTAIIHDLERFDFYGNKTQHNDKDLVVSSTMKTVDGECTFNKGDEDVANDPERGMNVDFTLKMSSFKGPLLGGQNFNFPYFIALLDGQDSILSKTQMTLSTKFPSSGASTENEENLHVFVPMENEKDAKDYRILMGFQLTEKQVEDVRNAAQPQP